jgi:adenine-specific DNA-methyltransferase
MAAQVAKPRGGREAVAYRSANSMRLPRRWATLAMALRVMEVLSGSGRRGVRFLTAWLSNTISSTMLECRLVCGDLLDVLRGTPSDSVDLTVTSPPYNIGKEYEHNRPLSEYIDWCREWLNEIFRVTKPSGALWLNLGYIEVEEKGRAVPLSYLLWNQSPFFLQQEIVWHYGAGVASRRAFSPRNEKWLWFLKDPLQYTFNLDAVRDPNVKYPNQKKDGKLKCNPMGKNPGDVWIIPKVTSGNGRASPERTSHPAQFPLAVVKRIILASSNPGELVLDPFAGSGSTLVASIHAQRRCIGVEVRAEYCAIAERRIRAARARVQELALFN